MAPSTLLPDLLCDVCTARKFAVTLEPRLRKRRWRNERQYRLEVQLRSQSRGSLPRPPCPTGSCLVSNIRATREPRTGKLSLWRREPENSVSRKQEESSLPTCGYQPRRVAENPMNESIHSDDEFFSAFGRSARVCEVSDRQASGDSQSRQTHNMSVRLKSYTG